MPALTLKLKGRELQRASIQKSEFLIGREHDCDLCIDNIGISRYHARIVFREGHFVLMDGESSNGTFVNGTAVQEHVLRHQDEIQLGKYSILFSTTGDASDFVPTSDLTRQVNLTKEQPKNIFGTVKFSSDELQELITSTSQEESRLPPTAPYPSFRENNEIERKNTLIFLLGGLVVILLGLLVFVLVRGN